MNIYQFTRRECKIQDDCSMESCLNMLSACKIALNMNIITMQDILLLGELIKPDHNTKGFRNTPVIFKNLSKGLHPELIKNALTNLVNAQEYLSPIEFYQEFELIHPFEDGNGRLGAILYNVLNKSMNDPILPPELF
jgi:hypothetical protein